MNGNLIPSPDMLGFPATPWPVLVLLNLLLALHWVFIGGVFGATFVVLVDLLRGPRDETGARMHHAILSFLPFTLSMGVTLGIAPLLFVQVLYGNFFYTANILVAGWWLLIIPLVIANTYLFYYAKKRIEAGRASTGPIAAVVLVFFVLLATILVSNGTLTHTPRAWTAVWQWRGAALYLGGGVIPRVTFAVLGFLTIGALAVTFLGMSGLMHEAEAAARAIGLGMKVAFPASVLQAAAGVLFLILAPGDQRRALLIGSWMSLFTYLALAALVATPVLLRKAQRAGAISPRALALPAHVYALGLLAIAFAREGMRQVVVAPYFKLAEVPVYAQWGPFALFLAFLVVAAVAVVVLVRLATVPEQE